MMFIFPGRDDRSLGREIVFILYIWDKCLFDLILTSIWQGSTNFCIILPEKFWTSRKRGSWFYFSKIWWTVVKKRVRIEKNGLFFKTPAVLFYTSHWRATRCCWKIEVRRPAENKKVRILRKINSVRSFWYFGQIRLHIQPRKSMILLLEGLLHKKSCQCWFQW